MIETLDAAEYFPESQEYFHLLKKKKHADGKEEIRMLFFSQDDHKELADTIWKNFSTVYFSAPSSPYDQFEECLKVINAEVSRAQYIAAESDLRKMAVVLMVFAEGTLHISVVGHAEVYLIRKNKATIISEGLALQKFESDLFINIASGELENNDGVIVTSERLLRYITESQLVEIMHNTVEDAKMAIEEVLHMSDASASFFVLRASAKNDAILPFDVDEKNIRKDKKEFPSEGKSSLILGKVRFFVRSLLHRLRGGEQKTFLGLILGILALIVIVSLTVSFSGESNDQEYQQYKELLAQVQTSLKNVENLEIRGDTEVAKANLEKIERDLESILQSRYFRSESTAAFEELAQIRDRITGTTRIFNPKVLANLKSKKNEVSAKGIFNYNDEWYAFDQNSLLRIVLEEVENVLPLSDTQQMKKGVPLVKKKKFIFLDDAGKVFEYDAETSAFSLSKTEDESWKVGVDIASYSDNIYMLSPADNQVWKYEYKSEGFSPKIPYLIGENDLSQAISLAIDGDIFVLSSGGEVKKFYKGSFQDYEIIGAPAGSMAGVTRIYTNPEMEHLLFLNPTEKAVYIFYKGEAQAQYDSQIVFENVGELQGLWAKAPKTLVLVDETKAYIEDF